MDKIRVQVCYAKPDVCILRELFVPEGSTLQAVIEQSGVLGDEPKIDLTMSRVGVHGKLKPLDALVRNDDRVEIYRPLIADPKESRRKRAVKKDETKAR